MAIVIKELQVKLHLGGEDSSKKSKNRGRKRAKEERAAVVDDAVKEVLRILKQQKEK